MRTVLELQGNPCIPMEEERIGRAQLIVSRSFATHIITFLARVHFKSGQRRVSGRVGAAAGADDPSAPH